MSHQGRLGHGPPAGRLRPEPLEVTLADPDPEFRLEVLEVLGDREDLESLRRAKSDPAQDVRERAVELLESAGASR